MTRRRRTAVCVVALAATLGLSTGEAAAAATVMRTKSAAAAAAPPEHRNEIRNETPREDRSGDVSPVGRWETQQRPQLLHAFAEHVYGHPLPARTRSPTTPPTSAPPGTWPGGRSSSP